MYTKEELELMELVFEITRRCNLQCVGYCMRGISQNVDMSPEIVKRVFYQQRNVIKYIHSLVLSGGEPTLHEEMIEYIVEQVLKSDIKINQLRMVTNGQLFSQKIVNSFKKFEMIMKERFFDNGNHYKILFSVDQFHNPIPNEVIELYKANGIFVKENIIFSNSKKNIIKTGLATEIGRDFVYDCPKIRSITSDNIKMILDEIYIAANGNVTTNGMGSYEDMDKINMGNIMETSILNMVSNNEQKLGKQLIYFKGRTK